MGVSFKFASISDVHLHHPHTTTVEIVDKLGRIAFPDNAKTASLDAIFIGGDLFDRIMSLNDPDVPVVERWMERMLRLCKKHNILLRVLEGTPSHDRKQSQQFVTVNDICNIGCDLRYIDRVEVELIEQFGVSVLYIPDEWKNDTDEAWKDANTALSLAGLEKVDYAIMHGSFHYQLPAAAVKAPKHVEERYLSIVKRVITIGHIHDASNFERIYANGSFDRIGHGYEPAKGFWIIDSQDDVDTATFIENTEAKIFKTIDCRGLVLEEALNKISYVIELKYPVDSHFQILALPDDPILFGANVISQKYPIYNWKITRKELKARTQQELIEAKQAFIPMTINKDTIVDIVARRMEQKNIDPLIAATAASLLESGRQL